LEWTGHVARTDQGRRVKKLFVNIPEGSRRRGRPRLRWVEDVEKDLWEMKGKKWRQKAVDREVYASDTGDPKVVRGPYSVGVSE
jgi:hypothetical protein